MECDSEQHLTIKIAIIELNDSSRGLGLVQDRPCGKSKIMPWFSMREAGISYIVIIIGSFK